MPLLVAVGLTAAVFDAVVVGAMLGATAMLEMEVEGELAVEVEAKVFKAMLVELPKGPNEVADGVQLPFSG